MNRSFGLPFALMAMGACGTEPTEESPDTNTEDNAFVGDWTGVEYGYDGYYDVLPLTYSTSEGDEWSEQKAGWRLSLDDDNTAVLISYSTFEANDTPYELTEYSYIGTWQETGSKTFELRSDDIDLDCRVDADLMDCRDPSDEQSYVKFAPAE